MMKKIIVVAAVLSSVNAFASKFECSFPTKLESVSLTRAKAQDGQDGKKYEITSNIIYSTTGESSLTVRAKNLPMAQYNTLQKCKAGTTYGLIGYGPMMFESNDSVAYFTKITEFEIGAGTSNNIQTIWHGCDTAVFNTPFAVITCTQQ